MKTILLSMLLAIATTASAHETVVKECSVTMKQIIGDKMVNLEMKIIAKEDKSLYAKVTETIDGVSSSYNDEAQISEEKVRANLTAEFEYENLNEAEGLIVHAMSLSEDPVFHGAFSAGVDLKKVRSAKMYTVGESTRMGSATIVEAKDLNNQILGSFLGGFVVSPCK
ncbi:MAG: hypothetical protein AABY64_12400 [Bdellovibrionota bacterium]